MKVDCVILAAGFSSRMGKNKMLLEIGRKTVIERCINAFDESCSRIIVVTGKYHDDIKQCLSSYAKVKLVYNRDYRQGMFSSVKEGIRQIESERFFVTPGDYSLLKADTIKQMLNTRGRFVVPVYQGKKGHPILLDKWFIPVILNSYSNLRECLKEFESTKLNINDEGVVRDLDTNEAYHQMRVAYPTIF